MINIGHVRAIFIFHSREDWKCRIPLLHLLFFLCTLICVCSHTIRCIQIFQRAMLDLNVVRAKLYWRIAADSFIVDIHSCNSTLQDHNMRDDNIGSLQL